MNNDYTLADFVDKNRDSKNHPLDSLYDDCFQCHHQGIFGHELLSNQYTDHQAVLQHTCGCLSLHIENFELLIPFLNERNQTLRDGF